jgi:hypothetical protein
MTTDSSTHTRTGRVTRCLVAAALGLAAFGACAQSRIVIVNGRLLSDEQVAYLARLNCSSEIPEGSYWLNGTTRAWGYAGNPQVQGVLGDGCSVTGGTGGQVAGNGSYGPYATLRRAEEVANDFRRQGLQAIAFHNGDGYYVRVKR